MKQTPTAQQQTNKLQQNKRERKKEEEEKMEKESSVYANKSRIQILFWAGHRLCLAQCAKVG